MIELNTKAGSLAFSTVIALAFSLIGSLGTLHAQGVHNLDTGESFNTITEAIDDADTLNGHTLSVDPGTYVENVYVTKGLTIQSASGDPEDTKIQGNAEWVIEVQYSDVTIDGFTVQSNNQASGIGIGQSYCTISNCIIRDNYKSIGGWAPYTAKNITIQDNLIFNSDFHGIWLYNARNSVISGNKITAVTSSFGIWVQYCDHSTISSNIIDSNSGTGLELYWSDQCLIEDNTITDNNEEGLTIYHATNATLRGNELSGNTVNFAIDMGYMDPVYYQHDIDTSNTVERQPICYFVNKTGVQVPSDAGYVAAVDCVGVNAENLTLGNNRPGLLLVNTRNSTFENLDLSNTDYGLYAYGCLNNTYSQIKTSNCDEYGFYFYESEQQTMNDCEVDACDKGIRLVKSDSNSVTDCLIINCDAGAITIDSGDSNTVIGNEFSQNDYARVSMFNWSILNLVQDNQFVGNNITIIQAAGSPANMIIGNYIDASANFYDGMITVEETHDVLVFDNILQNGTQYGIWLDEATGCTVEGNTLSEFPEEPSIWVGRAHSNIIRNNTFRDCQYGLQLFESNDNEIKGNIYSYIWRGMMLKTSHDNVITNNSFLECTDIELMLDVSDNNEVYHNDFLATTLRVYDVGADNTWDNGYPSGGNYWSTYNGSDLDGDGIGDTQIEVLPAGNNNYDRYPLMTPANLTFFSDKAALSESTGGQINLYAEAGHANAFRKYLVVGGLSGTDPGQPLPGGLATIPVNFDAFTHYVVFPYLNTVLFTNFLGILDEDGRAHPVINAPPVPGFAGNTMHYAFCCNNPFDFASNAVAVEIVP